MGLARAKTPIRTRCGFARTAALGFEVSDFDFELLAALLGALKLAFEVLDNGEPLLFGLQEAHSSEMAAVDGMPQAVEGKLDPREPNIVGNGPLDA